MIIRRVRVYPFGCFADSELAFAPGLNVVLGPNEAGKSTIFRAIRLALLAKTKLQKKDVADQVDPHLPVSGGDFLRAELELQSAGGRCVLRRRWGSAPASELVLPGGGSLSDEDAIMAEILKILPAKRGTTANILMTGQAALAETMVVLRDPRRGADSVSDLSDLLRSTVLSMGGVAVHRFVARLAEMQKEAWLHWDKAANGPEKGRGIENRWERGVGPLLAAWYVREDARAAWKQALAYEAGVDDVNTRLRAVSARRAEREAFVAANAAAARDARERRTLEAELRAARSEAKAAVEVSREWPVAAARVRELAEAAGPADAARAALEGELRDAQKAEGARVLRERHERVQRRKAQVSEAGAKLAAVPRLEKKSLDELRASASALMRLEAGAEAGMISVTVAGRADAEISVQEDFSPEDRRTLTAGKTTRLRATGRIRIVHRDMEIEVRSGDADAGGRAEKIAAARAVVTALLSRHGCADLEAAEERARVYEALAADLRAAEKSLAEELGSETLAALESRLTALGPLTETRPLATVSAELASARAQSEARAREIAGLNRRIDEWGARHGTVDRLLAALGAAKGKEADLLARIEKSAPLPQGYADAEAFLKDFEAAQADLSERTAELRGLEERKRNLDQGASGQSSEELAVQAKDMADSFERSLRRARTVDRLLALSTGLLAESESVVFSGMEERLSETLAAMTGGKHGSVVMDGPMPVGISAGPGGSLSWDQLSAGTKDTLALALRLAMASYFLSDADGFLLMDDPLVDMDPQRQAAAAAALKDFASKRQLILFTCHPATAELLGGNLVSLDAGR